MRRPSVPARELRLPLWLALLTAVAGGVLLDVSFPSPNVWVAAFPGLALTLIALRGRSTGGAILVGIVSGFAFFFLLIHWVTTYLGPVPWIALAAFEGLFFAAGCAAIALAERWIPRVLPNAVGRLVVLPIAVGGLWTAREYLAGHYPYGGFSWGRIAESQSTSPLAPLAAWLGLAGLSFLIVAVVALLVQLVAERPVRVLARTAIALVAVGGILVVPAWPTRSDGTATIASVQGDSRAGFFQQHEYGDLTNAQVEATYDHVPTTKKVDMVVWPEGASDRDPTRDQFGRYAFDTISRRYDAPLVSGVITQKGSKLYNSSIVWSGGRVTSQYDKRHLVPFGEYVPDRAFFNALAPSLVGLLTRDETPGSGSNVLSVKGTRAGFAICFDIVDDALTTQMVDGGAQVILAQTNNADFGRSDENAQQLAIARLRAIETARPLVNISTVGSSAVISAHGTTVDAIPAYRPGAMVTTVTLGSGITPAIRIGAAIEAVVSWLGFALLVGAGVITRRNAKTRRQKPTRDERAAQTGALTGVRR